jgi:hypothetical protein
VQAAIGEREEYVAMVEMFASLAADFGERVSPATCRDLERLAASVECIDRKIDNEPDDEARGAAWRGVLGVLDGAGPAHLDDELSRAAIDLRELAASRNARARVARIMRKEARVAETMRRTEHAPTYVRCALREGRLGAALTLAVAPARSDFRRFFFRLGGPANVIDKIVDVRADHGSGEVRIRPSVRVYAQLLLALAITVPLALASHPRWPRIVFLGLRWFRRLAS